MNNYSFAGLLPAKLLLSILAALILSLVPAALSVHAEEQPIAQAVLPAYDILVNRATNQIIVRDMNQQGLPLKVFRCSTGKHNATPCGTYKTSASYRWKNLYGNCYGQYATRFATHMLFHSVPYRRADPGSLYTNKYNQLGNQASMGCIRMTVRDSKWLFDHIPSGTTVTVIHDPELILPFTEEYFQLPEGVTWDPTDEMIPADIMQKVLAYNHKEEAPVPAA